MQNRTLENKSFAQSFKSYTPNALIEVCQTKFSSMNICDNASNWAEYIKFRYGRKYVDGRPDIITADQMKDHAVRLENAEKYYFYAAIGNDQEFGALFLVRPDQYLTPAGLNQLLPVPNYLFWDFRGEVEGAPITSNETIFYACCVYEEKLGRIYSKSARIFASPELCSEFIVQYLKMRGNDVSRHILYKPSFTNDRMIPFPISADYTLYDLLMESGFKHPKFEVQFSDAADDVTGVFWFPCVKEDMPPNPI